MIRRSIPKEKKEFEEQLVQKFPHRCPYCDRPISYDSFNLKPGENGIQCPSCKMTYIKVVSDPMGNHPARKNSHARRGAGKGRGK